MRVKFTLHRFRLQLVGYRSCSVSHDDDVISIDRVRRGAGLAQEELESRVFDATLSELSPADIEFLLAMSRDEDKTLQANLKTRLAKSPSQCLDLQKAPSGSGCYRRAGPRQACLCPSRFQGLSHQSHGVGQKNMGKPRFAQLPLPNNLRTEQVARGASAGAGSASIAITFGAL